MPFQDHRALVSRAALASLAPYSGCRDTTAVRRDTGLKGLFVNLASNKGAEGPFSATREAMESAFACAQRYPDAYAAPVAVALVRFHGVIADEVIVGSSACALLAPLSSSILEVSDEVNFGRPTFHLYQ